MSVPIDPTANNPANPRPSRPVTEKVSSGAFRSVTANAFAVESIAQTGEYSIFGLQRPQEAAAARGRKRAFTVMLFVGATLLAAIYSLEQYLRSRFMGEPFPIGLLPLELVSTYLWIVLTPAVMWISHRYPLWDRGRLRHWVAHFGGMVVFVVAHGILVAVVTRLFGLPGVRMSLPAYVIAMLLTWSVLDCLVYAMLVMANHALVSYRVSKDRALRASQLEAKLAQAQLHVLRMQLHPHFLFNTLHSISALMHKDVGRADSMITALSDLLRMSLQNVGAQEVPLQSELEFLQRYADVMALRFGDRVRVTMDVSPDAADALVPNLFLQPLVENSIRHGISDRIEGGTVTVLITRQDGMLVCDIVDDGRGLPAGRFTEGVGLTTTRSRLRDLYGDRQRFEIRSGSGQGVRVTMAIPYRAEGSPKASPARHQTSTLATSL